MNRNLNGIVVLDKPAGPSSAKVVAEVKKIFGVPKCGHAGTLDPFATGVLICCINQGTRLARFFLHDEKRYEAVVRLGISTDTEDFTGCTTEENTVPEYSETQLHRVFESFMGTQLQQPPVYAALKHNGTPLYKLARKGEPIQKAARPITIKQLRIMDVQLPDIMFEVSCSAGTYVRTLCADIGKRLGCGGHLARLRRTASSGFTIDKAVTLSALHNRNENGELQSALIPMAQVLGNMPTYAGNDQVIEHILYGRRLNAGQLEMPVEQAADHSASRRENEGFIKIIDRHGELRAVVQQVPDSPVYNYCCVFH